MESDSVLRTRRSIRAFLPEPLPENLVTGILDEARWAPSWANAQDWRVFAVTGDALQRVKAGLAEAVANEAPSSPELPFPAAEWPDHLAARMTYRRPAPGAAPAPPQRPGLWDVYNAPVLLLFAADERLAPAYAAFDSGLLVENVCLAAASRGLGTCIMAMVVRYPEVLRSVVPAEGLRLVIAVALGKPDPDAELNAVQRERAPLDEIVTWVR